MDTRLRDAEAAIRRAMGVHYDRHLRRGMARIAAGAPRHGLTDAEIAILHAYTDSEPPWNHEFLNLCLRSGDPEIVADVDNWTRALGAALAMLPDHAGIAWRGTRLPDEALRRHAVGATVLYRGFTSASSMPDKAFPGPHRIRILSRHGKWIAPYSAYPDEGELLFQAGTRFRVLEREGAGAWVSIAMEEVTR